jgi:hypothetical protein
MQVGFFKTTEGDGFKPIKLILIEEHYRRSQSKAKTLNLDFYRIMTLFDFRKIHHY